MLPREIDQLFEKFGQCDIIDKIEKTPYDFDILDISIRLGTCVIIKDKDEKLVLVKLNRYRPDIDSEHWFFVCGKMEEGESFEDTGVREAWEEIGCDIRIIGVHHVGHHYVVVDEIRHTLYYGAALFADLVSGIPRVNSEEICEVATFKRIPDNFLPGHKKYYTDL